MLFKSFLDYANIQLAEKIIASPITIIIPPLTDSFILGARNRP